MTVPLPFDQLTLDRQQHIRANLATLRAKRAPDHDIEAYLQAERIAPTNAELTESAPAQEPTRAGSGRTWGGEDGSLSLNNLSRAALHGATLGAGTKLEAGANAVVDRLHGEPFDASYARRLAEVREKERVFGEAHPVIQLGTELGGGMGALLATSGGAAPTVLPRASAALKLGKAMWSGAKVGATAGAINSDGGLADRARDAAAGGAVGAASAAALTPIFAGAGYLANKAGLPDAASRVAQYAAERLPQGRMQSAMARMASSTGARGGAASEIAQRMRMDQEGGHVAPTIPNDVPTMALDYGGPNVEGLAENIVHRPGPGKATLSNALTQRSEQMRPSVQSALATRTGVPANPGTRQLQTLLDARRSEADRLYDIARTATAGQPVQSETLRAITDTPAGKTALAWAKAQKANRMSPLATGEGTPPGYTPEQWSEISARMQERGLPAPDVPGEELPDPETLHFMKQALATMARLGMRDGAQGTVATQAQSVLGLWGKLRNELPPEWRAADDAYAKWSRLIEADRLGRNVFRTTSNPGGPAGKAALTSLGGLDRRASGMGSAESQSLQVGAASAAHSLLDQAGNGVASPGRIFARSPERVQQMRYAFPDPAAADAFQNTVSAWDAIQGRSSRLTGNSRTATRLGEAQLRDDATPGMMGELVRGNVGNAVRAVAGGVNKEATNRARERLDAQIAAILTARDPHALLRVNDIALARQRVRDLLNPLAGGILPLYRSNP